MLNPMLSVTGNMQALVVDDDPLICQFVADVLRADGWQVSVAETAARALEMIAEQRWSLVFCDVLLGGVSGFDVLRQFVEKQPDAQIVLMTGYGSAADAMDAMALGAYDYLLKPFGIRDVEELSKAVRKRFEKQRHVETEEPAASARASDLNLIGKSPALINVMKMVGRLAATSLPVLITGESGTGKEVVARAIHYGSPRAPKPFVAVNCGALPSELIESELFGHMRGSFTGAERDRPGLFEEADGGTILLDEIAETTLDFQVKLLRALQQGEIRRVGANRSLRIDVRVIAASNREPKAEVREGRFRQDLFYRLNGINLHLPPLRERREDILLLVKHFAGRVRAGDEPRLRFSREAVRLLEEYAWPGNIRELENAVLHAAALCDHTVRPEDLPKDIRHSAAHPSTEKTIAAPDKSPILTVEDWMTLERLEGEYVARLLEHTGGNKLAAARILNVDRKTLDRMLAKHKIDFRSTHRASFPRKPRS
ncbi:MAG: sigma-54-dependent transcriptional regulator [Pyrinomonadaceae bacterium]